MAKAKQNVAPTTVAGTDPSVPGAAPAPDAGTVAELKGRAKANPDETIYWDGVRDTALLNILMAENGQLTSKQVVAKLAQSPAFAGAVHLLSADGAAEKVRQRAKKMGEDFEELGLGSLSLRRTSNQAYDRRATILAIAAAAGRVPATGYVQPTTAPVPQAQVPSATAQVQAQQPIVPLVGGGLIPTA